jgi:hypothetical protein
MCGVLKKLAFALNIISAGAAFAAAAFWFKSAAIELPPMVSYFNQAPPNDPFRLALEASARDNRYAAAWAGVSALTLALATVTSLLAERRRSAQ